MGLGRVELPTSRFSGCHRYALKPRELPEYLDTPRDLPGGLGAEYGRKPIGIDTTIDTTRSSRERRPAITLTRNNVTRYYTA